MKRVAFFSHGHPKYSKGGAEIFAYELFEAANQHEDIEASFFCAGRDLMFEGGVHCKNFSFKNSKLTDKQFIVRTPACDYDYFFHKLSNGKHAYYSVFEQVGRIDPQVIHFQHFLGFGLPLIKGLKRNFPGVKILLTLHDYMLICARDGKILNNDSGLCNDTDYYRCNNCVNMGGEHVHLMKDMFIKNILTSVDMFISPSKYLIERFLEWGIEDKKIVCIPNGRKFVDDREGINSDFKEGQFLRTSDSKEKPVVFAYFGQLMRVKGIFLLLEAIDLLPKNINAIFYINGNDYGLNHDEKILFRDRLNKHRRKIVYMGPYEQDDMDSRMQNIDWVICPSIWPENAPLVIQEAFHYKKPILCPSAGAFTEFVHNNLTGLYFNRNDHYDLSQKIIDCCNNKELINVLRSNIKPQQGIGACMSEHLSLYSDLCG